MTTLQELLEQWEARSKDALPTDAMLINKHIRELRAALAQQGEQQPVAWYEYNQDLDAWFLAYGRNPKAKTRPLVFGDTAAPAPVAQQVERKNCPQPEICGSKECEFCRDTAAPAQQPVAYITDTEQGPMVWTPEMYDEACTYCDDGEFPVPLYTAAPAPQAQQPVAFFPPLPRSVLRCAQTVVYDAMQMRQYAMRFTELLAAAPAPQPAQGVPEVGFGNMPYSPYLFGGLRFKMNFDKSGNATNFHGVESALQGAWVALVDATDNRHLQSAQPVARPLTLEQLLDIVKKLGEPT